MTTDTNDSGAMVVMVEQRGEGIVQIRLNRPERMNALGVDMTLALERAISDAIAARARVILVRGTGRAFCAGAEDRKSVV